MTKEIDEDSKKDSRNQTLCIAVIFIIIALLFGYYLTHQKNSKKHVKEIPHLSRVFSN